MRRVEKGCVACTSGGWEICFFSFFLGFFSDVFEVGWGSEHLIASRSGA